MRNAARYVGESVLKRWRTLPFDRAVSSSARRQDERRTMFCLYGETSDVRSGRTRDVNSVLPPYCVLRMTHAALSEDEFGRLQVRHLSHVFLHQAGAAESANRAKNGKLRARRTSEKNVSR